jgi:NAD(P)-dependent dehydrogenase (short-subunit alcohol dehydrogenase family)
VVGGPRLTGLADQALELSIVGSFSRLGAITRRRLFAWAGPAPADRGGPRPLAVVTGASSGIGRATAEALVSCGWRVAIVSRDPARHAVAVDSLQTLARVAGGRGAPAAVEGFVADLGDLVGVRKLAGRIADLGPLAALVHNAGVLNREFHRGEQGFEATFAVSVLGPTLLSALLLEPLRAGARPGGSARLVTVSSGGMYPARLDIGRLEHEGPTRYRPIRTYSLTRRAQVELGVEWARRLAGTGVIAVTMHPGWVATAGLDHGLPAFARVMRPALRTPAEGADTVVWLVTTPTTRSCPARSTSTGPRVRPTWPAGPAPPRPSGPRRSTASAASPLRPFPVRSTTDLRPSPRSTPNL